MPKPIKTIAQLIKELDEIVAWFESDQADVNAAIVKYEQGLKTLAELASRLKAAKVKVKQLEQKFDQ